MHEKVIDISKVQNTSRVSDPILRDYLRVSGSPMVTRYSDRAYGVRTTKKTGQSFKRWGVNTMVYLYRAVYSAAFVCLTALVAVIWG